MPLNLQRHLQLLLIYNVTKTSCVCLHYWEQVSLLSKLGWASSRVLEGGSWEQQQSRSMLDRSRHLKKGSDCWLFSFFN